MLRELIGGKISQSNPRIHPNSVDASFVNAWNGSVTRKLLWFLIFVGLIVWASRGPKIDDPIAESWAFYQSQPKLLRPRAFQKTPTGLANLRAETCGQCHQEIYREWQASTHARAWLDDAQYQQELQKHKHEHGQDTAWICVNCHTPLMNQLQELVIGLEDQDLGRPIKVANPEYDRALQHEAVSCATCHVKDGMILGVYGDTLAPHPVKVDPKLKSHKLCTECHEARANFAEAAISCVFETEAEWQQSEHAKQGKICQTCHMPQVVRPIAWRNLPPRKTRRHFFGGSLIAKRPSDQDDIDLMRRYYNEGLEIEVDDSQVVQNRQLLIVLQNKNAGHFLPTGDPERFFEIAITLKNENRDLIYQTTRKIGTLYQWSPLKKISDNRIAPGEKRLIKIEVPGYVLLRPLNQTRLEIRISKFRISKANLKFHNLLGQVVPGYPIYLDARTLQSIELRPERKNQGNNEKQ